MKNLENFLKETVLLLTRNVLTSYNDAHKKDKNINHLFLDQERKDIDDELIANLMDSSANDFLEAMKQFECKVKNLLLSPTNKISTLIESIHDRENERKNMLRLQYDDKLSISRLSYLLQQRHASDLLMMQNVQNVKEMKTTYTAKLNNLNGILQQSQDTIQVQEKYLKESIDKANKMEEMWKCTQQDFEMFKTDMSHKFNKLKEDLNRKIKQEVWAHFKIMNLKRKLKKSEKMLYTNKISQKNLILNIRELKERLKVSLEIRSGMEKSFERRATIRGRVDIFNQEKIPLESSKLYNNKPINRQSKIRTNRNEKQCQTEHRPIKLKHQGVNSSPFFTDTIKALKQQVKHLESKVEKDMQKYELVKFQNDAYKRLISGKNIARILASEYRDLSTKPNSMEAQILYDLTSPQGVLLHKGPNYKDKKKEANLVSKRRIESRDSKCGSTSSSIPSSKSNTQNFDGIVNQITSLGRQS